ncbi:formyltransferase family protein [Psychrobacillus sp. FSL K6-1415]|uniref:formyltransferase family protein n=1 Tax=Psychrobacillus sp. FSL K6-1415 TaxID=2921544 RepID=UPI0030F8DA62
MKILLLTGSHPRHLFLVNELVKTGFVMAHLMEKREEFLPQPPAELESVDRVNFISHFKDRDDAEYRHFEGNDMVSVELPTLDVTMQQLNSAETIEWVKSQQFDLAISYGVHKLSDELLEALGGNAWNIHGGLSPWYKGNTTLFWPFYMLRPNWAGMTIHRLSSRLDAGEIVHHSVPQLAYGDGLHDVACKAVIQVANDLTKIITTLKLEEINYIPQKGNGKLWIGTDWMPQHLRFVYNTYNNDIVDQFLDGKLTKIDPPLVSAFSKGE